MKPNNTNTCPTCQGARMLESSDVRPYYRVCKTCHGEGEVTKPDCFEPIEGLKHNVVAVLDAIGNALQAQKALVNAPVPSDTEMEMERLQERIIRLENLPPGEAMTLGTSLTLAALKSRLAVLDKASNARNHDVN